MRTVFGCSQSNWPWHSFVCSVAPDDSHFPLILSCWCSMHRVRTLFFDSPIYFPLHEQTNWYTPGWLFGSSLGLLFWQRICCRFFPDAKAISFPIFLNSCFIFGLMFGIQGNFFRFLYSQFSVLFSWLFLLLFLLLCFITNFFKSCLLWPFSTKISSKKFSSSLIHFSEHIECACKGNLWIHFWWC